VSLPSLHWHRSGGFCWLLTLRCIHLSTTLINFLDVKARSLDIVSEWLSEISIYNQQVPLLPIIVWMMPIYRDFAAIDLVYGLSNSNQVVLVVELRMVFQVVHDMLIQHLVTL
jgi:hypothetical protein